MAKVATKDVVYFVTFTGIYYNAKQPGDNQASYKVTVPIGHEQLTRTYTTKVPLENGKTKDKTVVADSALSLFRRDYAPLIMPQKYPDYQALATFEIEDVTCTHPEFLKDNVALMNMYQLTNYIEENDLEIETILYDDAGSLRSAIKAYKEDREGFLSVQEQTRKRKGKKVVQVNAAKAMLDKFKNEMSKPKKLDKQTSKSDDEEEDFSTDI